MVQKIVISQESFDGQKTGSNRAVINKKMCDGINDHVRKVLMSTAVFMPRWDYDDCTWNNDGKISLYSRGATTWNTPLFGPKKPNMDLLPPISLDIKSLTGMLQDGTALHTCWDFILNRYGLLSLSIKSNGNILINLECLGVDFGNCIIGKRIQKGIIEDASKLN